MRDWRFEPARDLGLSPAERFRSLRRESGLVSTGLHLAWRAAVRGYLAVWHRLTIEGRRNLPAEPPFVLVAHHTSHLDALVLAAPLPGRLRDRTFPLAAGDTFFRTPLRAAFAAGLLNALPLRRDRCGAHALDELRRRLTEEPCIYILFPEGTRSRDGRPAPFKPGVGMLTAETAVPVVPCCLDGCFRALPPGSRRPRPVRIRLRIGPPVEYSNVKNDRDGRLHIAADLQARVQALAFDRV